MPSNGIPHPGIGVALIGLAAVALSVFVFAAGGQDRLLRPSDEPLRQGDKGAIEPSLHAPDLERTRTRDLTSDQEEQQRREKQREGSTQNLLRVISSQDGRPVRSPRAYPSDLSPVALSSDGVDQEHRVPNKRTFKGPVLIGDENGIVRLPPGFWQGYVYAPGFAWMRVQHRGGEEAQLVKLPEGGGLTVSVLGWDQVRNPVLTLRYERGGAVELPDVETLEEGVMRVDGLRCGDHELILSSGAVYLGGRVHSRAPVSIVAGQDALVTMAPQIRQGTTVHLTGQLEVPRSWPSEYYEFVQLVIAGRDEENADVLETIVMRDLKMGGRTEFASSEAIPLGRYEVEVIPFQHKEVVLLQRAMPGLTITVPDVTTLRIYVSDVSGGRITDATLLWRMMAGEDDTAGGLAEASLDAATQSFTLRVPSGVVKLRVQADGYRQLNTEERLEVPPNQGQLTHVIEMARAALLVVSARNGPSPVPVSVDLHSADGGATVAVSVSSSNGVARFPDLPGGEYVLSISVPSRFQELESRRLVVKPGETVRINVQCVQDD